MTDIRAAGRPAPGPRRFSPWWGLLPLAFFLARLAALLRLEEPEHILWVCHVSNLLLAVGLVARQLALQRAASLWLLLGPPIWLWESFGGAGISGLTTVGTHLGGAAVAWLALRRSGVGRFSWFASLVWYGGLQLASRLWTPPAYNVNLAHMIQPGWETLSADYRVYWLVTTGLAAVALWLLNRWLAALWPEPQPAPSGSL